MAVPRLHPESCALLIIDVQERLVPTIHEAEAVVSQCTFLVKACQVLRIPVLATEHYAKGLGPTVEPLRSALADAHAPILHKTRFSAAVPEVHEHLARLGRGTVILAGMETHVCVLQTALDLCCAGIQPFLATDATGSSQPGQDGHARRRMESAGCLPTGAMSAVYELLGDASNPAFRGCLGLLKESLGQPARQGLG